MGVSKEIVMIYRGFGFKKAGLNLVFIWLLSFFILALKTLLSESLSTLLRNYIFKTGA